ncbi:unnamed protein product [Echinostoma caproni]|uniref:Uncharacterized protein n=1 Tax=Echinostoma caproni TaxID=27848 RepID=A0A183AJS2_9TREM|nr:unnamed protein product [Echinostoma caproni]
MGVAWCSSTGHFYFDSLPTNPYTEQTTPWTVAHSSRQRCKLVESLIVQNEDRCTAVVRELRNLATTGDENPLIPGSATFADLLVPLLTSKPKPIDGPNNDNDLGTLESSDDVLILFGSPATVFQLLLSISSLRALLTDLILELVATSSSYSIQLLEQFKQPVGLTTMFNGQKAFAETAARLIELFQVVSEPSTQASILCILPDLASSPCTTNCALTDADRSILILKLIDLLNTIPTGTIDTVQQQQQSDPIACLIECLTSFSVDRDLALRLPDILFQLLDRCYTPDAYYAYLPLIARSVLIHGPAVSRQSTELPKLIRRLRTYFKFPQTPIKSSGDPVESTLVELLRVAFQFNRQLMNE